ncbi:tetratricopeptide repeat protein 22-like [Amphiura filiformis]|uniref:tetratricopeptide repeat protein 22-like n=1 Tax=Amphiura filiformis TaxID=82378 RepID=UPI003B218BB8
MSGSARGENDVPGLLTLDLAINKEKLTEIYCKQAKCKVELLKKILRNCPKRPHRFVLRHLITIFEFRLGYEDEAIQELEKLKEEDPCNLNVLQDLVTIFEKHVRKEDEADCLAKIAAIRDGKYNDSSNDSSNDRSNDSRLAQARCLAGQGLAWGFDLHVETRSTNRLDKSIDLFTKAIEIAGDSISDDERDDWLHYLALDYVRANNLKRIKEVKEYYKENLVKALECIEPNVRSEDQYRRSEALCLLGTLFSQRPANYLELVSFVQKDFKPYWYNPEKCFLASLAVNQSNFIALNQLARRYYYSDRKELEALDCLNKSLQLNSGPSNHEAFRIRARIHRSKYNKQVRDKVEHEKHNPQVGKPNVNDPSESHQNPDKNFLRLAMDDLQMCIKYNPYVLDMINLAEVYRKLAWKSKNEYDRHLLYRALSHCSMAEKCQDGAMRSDLHQCRALILQDLNDLDSAIQCFMQAIDCENPGTKYNRNFILLFYGLLRRYQNLADKPNHLLQQLAYWLEEGMHKYAQTGIKIGKFVTSYPEEMMSILEVLSDGERKKQLCLAEQCLQAFKDSQVSSDQAKLSTVDAKVVQSMAKYANQPEKPVSPSTKAGLKAKMQDLKLSISPVEAKLFQKTATTQIHEQPKEDTKEEKRVELIDDTIKSQDDGGATNKEANSARGILTSTPIQSHQPHPISEEKSTGKSTFLDLLFEQQNPHETKEASNVEVSDVIPTVSSVMSPSEIQPISPESSPLARYVESMKTSESEQTPSPYKRHSASQSASYEASPWTPQSLSDDSALSTPSTAGSVTVEFSVETPQKAVKRSISFPPGQVHHRDLFDAFRCTLEESDLRVYDIGDPPEKALHPDFEYDFYAVYDPKCEKTSDFVYYHLRSQLEEGTKPLKGCIQERDFLLGTPIIDNMEIAIESSAKILLLISTGFFENGWCKQATTLAFDPDMRYKLVPILLDHTPLPSRWKSIQVHNAQKTINWGLIRRNLEPSGSPSV